MYFKTIKYNNNCFENIIESGDKVLKRSISML